MSARLLNQVSDPLLYQLAVELYEIPDAHTALTVRGDGVTIQTNPAAPLDKQSLLKLSAAIEAVAATLAR